MAAVSGVVVQSVLHVGRQAVDGDRPDAELASFQETHMLLTQRQHKEPVIGPHQGQQRFHLETPVDDHRLGQLQRQAETLEETVRHEDRQTLAALIPEAGIRRQLAQRFQQLLRVGARATLVGQLSLGLADQVLEPQRILLVIDTSGMRGHEDRHARSFLAGS